jgi:nonribosomal peptide synthetase protein BlmVIII
MVARADIADAPRMRAVIEAAERDFGPLAGVVHAAGVPDLAGMIQRRTPAQTDEVIRAKTVGTLVLHEAVGDRPLDFFVLCSSIGTVLPKLKFGEVGYVAGNEFAEAFAEYRASRYPGITLAVAWSDWLEDGMSAAARARLAGPAPEILGGITSREGAEVFARLTGQGVAPRAVVSPQDLGLLLDRHAAFSVDDHLAGAVRRPGPAGPGQPAAGRAGQRLADPVQAEMAEFWSTLLGVDEVAAADDFFELGGDSLLALRLLAMVREAYGVDVPIARIFEQPTVAGLAGAVERARAAGRRPAADQEEVVL